MANLLETQSHRTWKLQLGECMIEDVVKKGHICFPMIPGFGYDEDAMEMSDVHPTHSEPPNT